MQISIDIPEEIVSRVVTAICANHGYNGNGAEMVFINQQLIEWVKCEIATYENRVLRSSSEQTLADSIKTKNEEINNMAIKLGTTETAIAKEP